jgi:hypothetical protein
MSFAQNDRPAPAYFRGSSKPYVRWWWLAGPFCERDIETQLSWVKQMGFGGVELAWLWPSWLPWFDSDLIPRWLGSEWSRLVAHAKRYADRIGLGCDFTLGSCWPFGGSSVEANRASQRSVELPLSSFVLLGRRHFIATCSSSIISTGRHCTHTSRR